MLQFEVEGPTLWIFCWTLGLMGAVGTQRERLLWICHYQTAKWELHCRKEVCFRQLQMDVPQSPETQCPYFLEGIETLPSVSALACPGPCSLSQLCRFCIRRSLGRTRLHRASSLFLPHIITDFLLYQWDVSMALCVRRALLCPSHLCLVTNKASEKKDIWRMGLHVVSHLILWHSCF